MPSNIWSERRACIQIFKQEGVHSNICTFNWAYIDLGTHSQRWLWSLRSGIDTSENGNIKCRPSASARAEKKNPETEIVLCEAFVVHLGGLVLGCIETDVCKLNCWVLKANTNCAAWFDIEMICALSHRSKLSFRQNWRPVRLMLNKTSPDLIACCQNMKNVGRTVENLTIIAHEFDKRDHVGRQICQTITRKLSEVISNVSQTSTCQILHKPLICSLVTALSTCTPPSCHCQMPEN